MEQFFNATLGPGVYKPTLEAKEYIRKFRSSTQAQTHATQSQVHVPRRQTPRFLRVICTSDDQQLATLGRDGMDVIVMRQEAMQGYGGSMTDALTVPIIPVSP